MRKTCFFWLGIGLLIFILIIVNYQSSKNQIPMSELFPDEEIDSYEVQYEYVDEETVKEDESKEGITEEVIEADRIDKAIKIENYQVKEKGQYKIQIGSLRDISKANNLLNAIKAKGYPAYVVTADLGSKGIWHRIYVGDFQDYKEAKETLNNLRQFYKDSFIISAK